MVTTASDIFVYVKWIVSRLVIARRESIDRIRGVVVVVPLVLSQDTPGSNLRPVYRLS
jgi:hypothetical protein